MILLLALSCTETPPQRQGEARALGLHRRELPDDLELQAWAALEADARRREARFEDAADPGLLFRSTRLPEEELRAGLWSTAEVYDIGGALFHLNLSPREGLGGADSAQLRRFHKGRRGGPDALSCAHCHWRGGPAGAGDGADNAYLDGDGDRQSTTLARNPPALVGAGLRELLAAEMSADLGQQRDELVAAARREGKPLRRPLESKGISFGWLGADGEGKLDLRGLEGVSADLVVRPFGWKGQHHSLREIIEEEAALHLGMQSSHLALHGEAKLVGDAPRPDPDGDGVIDELTEGQLSALTTYIALSELPISQLPSRQDWLLRWSEGEARFTELGCASCHRPSLPLRGAIWRLPGREGGAEWGLDLRVEGAEPRLSEEAGGLTVYLYSDMKRHAMGEALADPRPTGEVPADVFLTPPLWGLSRSRPYLHDGRAPDVDSAIQAHGGEALAARNAYVQLTEEQRYTLRLFLASLNRAPRLISP